MDVALKCLIRDPNRQPGGEDQTLDQIFTAEAAVMT